MGIKEFFQTIQWGATLQVAAIRIVIASILWPLLFFILGNTKVAEFFPLVFGFILVLAAFIAIAIPAIGLARANVPYIGLAALPAWMVVVADPFVKVLHAKRPDLVPVDEFKLINPPVLAIFQSMENYHRDANLVTAGNAQSPFENSSGGPKSSGLFDALGSDGGTNHSIFGVEDSTQSVDPAEDVLSQVKADNSSAERSSTPVNKALDEFIRSAVGHDSTRAIELWRSSSTQIIDKYRRARDDEDGSAWYEGNYALFDTLIWNGVKTGDADATRTVEALISAGVLLNEPDRGGLTPVGLLAMIGNLELLQLAIQSGGDVNAGDENALACLFGNRELDHGWTKVADLLVNAGINVNGSPGQTPPVFAALSRNHRDAIRFLVANGADLNRVHYIRRSDFSGTAMHYSMLAAFADDTNLETGNLLVELGGDPTVKNKEGFGAIDAFFASGREPTGNVNALVTLYSATESGGQSSLYLSNASPQASHPESSKQVQSNNNVGTSTPQNNHCQDLINSIKKGQSESVQSLLDYEDVWMMQNYRDAELENPLTLAIEECGADGITSVLKILAEKKFLINEPGEYNDRPIVSAIRLGNMAALNLLIDNEAELNWPKTDDGWPPALVAAAVLMSKVPKDRLVSIIDLLSQRGAEVNSSEGPALHYAMCANDRNGMRLAVLKKLIEIGADVNQVAVIPSLIRPAGSHIGTPIYAYYASGVDAVRILLDNGADLDVKNNHGENAIEFFEDYKKRAPSETETVEEIISLLRAHTR